MIKRILFIIFSILFFLFAFLKAKPVEVDLMSAFVNPKSEIERNIVKLANISSKSVNVIFEGNTPEEVEELRADFPQMETNFQDVVDVYRNYPANFISKNKRELLKEKKYTELQNAGLEGIYNPLGIYISPPIKDPYLFATDFVMSNAELKDDSIREFDGKYYGVEHLKIQNNKDLKTIVEAAQGKSIYLTGTPVHSYFASNKSGFEINIICLISTLVLVFLCKYYFRSVKILIPIALSILFGFLFGYSVSSLLFDKLHVLTFVFSTSLIGISLDYSLHYFLRKDDKVFRNSLTSSMLTTVIAFLFLYFSGIEVLSEVGIFTAFGLVGVYLFVLNILPMFGEFRDFSTLKKLKVSYKLIYAIVLIVIVAGCFNIKFNDDIRSFYTPPENLMRAENLYKKVFNSAGSEFLIVRGGSLDEILRKEEALDLENSIGLSNFVSSTQRQEENIKLVKDLYKNNLKSYEAKTGIIFEPEEFKIYDVEKFPLKDQFYFDEGVSYIIVKDHIDGSLNPASEISNMMKLRRVDCLKLLPLTLLVLFVLLSFIYGIKNAFRVSISPVLGILFTVGILSVFGESLNLFHILGLFLIAGFSLDYSIFRLNCGDESKDAVFISAISTAFSFMLLAFTSFKLVSSIGLTLFIGILTSYILSLFVVKNKVL